MVGFLSLHLQKDSLSHLILQARSRTYSGYINEQMNIYIYTYTYTYRQMYMYMVVDVKWKREREIQRRLLRNTGVYIL